MRGSHVTEFKGANSKQVSGRYRIKQHRVMPLALQHHSPAVRIRMLQTAGHHRVGGAVIDLVAVRQRRQLR